LFSSLNIIGVLKSRRIRLVDYVASTGEMKNTYTILVRKPEGKGSLGDLGIDGRC
jgi:hypothetical protein